MHDMAHVITEQFWLFALLIGVFLVLIPFSTAGIPGESIFNLEMTHAQMKFRFIHENFLVAVQTAAVLSGILTALSIFRFLRNKRETTMFMSLGMNRWQLFLTRSVTGILLLVLVVAIPMGISLWLNKRALGLYEGAVDRAVYLGIGLCLTEMLCFFITVFACAISGTLMETLLYSTVISGGIGILLTAINILMNKLVWGGARGISTYSGSPIGKTNLLQEWKEMNPLIFFYDDLETHSVFLRSGMQDFPVSLQTQEIWIWFVVTIAVFGIAYLALKYRKAEITGMSGGNHIFSEIVIAISAFFVATLVFVFFYDFSKIAAYITGAVIFLFVHFVWRKTVFSYEMTHTRKIVYAGVQLLFAGCILVFFVTDRFGYTKRILENSQFINARCSYVGSPNYLPVTTKGSSTANGYYLESTIDTAKPEEISRIVAIQKEFEKSGKQKKELNKEEFSKTVVPYDIEFAYIDEMGKEYYWYYDRASLEQLAKLNYVDDFASVRHRESKSVSGNQKTDSFVWASKAYETGEVYLSSSRYTDKKNLQIKEEERQGLLEAIAKDVEGQTFEDRYYPDKEANCILMFTETGTYDIENFAFHLNNAFVYVTDEYVNTMEWLNQNRKIPQEKQEIESITLQRFNPYENINGLSYPMSMYFMSYNSADLDSFLIQKDFQKKYTVTGKTEISQLEKGLRNTYFMNDGGYMAAVKMAGSEGYSYQFIPESDVPDFVVE